MIRLHSLINLNCHISIQNHISFCKSSAKYRAKQLKVQNLEAFIIELLCTSVYVQEIMDASGQKAFSSPISRLNSSSSLFHHKVLATNINFSARDIEPSCYVSKTFEQLLTGFSLVLALCQVQEEVRKHVFISRHFTIPCNS